MATSSKSKSLWDAKIMRQALIDSVRKLNPRTMMRNPVMFVVEVGSVITTVLLFKDIARHSPGFGFDLQITLWLWFTVLFANFAEAMAEGRGKAQAETLRRAKSETHGQPDSFGRSNRNRIRCKAALRRCGHRFSGRNYSRRWRHH